MVDFIKPARKITWVLFANQSLTSAAFVASSTINSILGAKLGGSVSYAGVPSAVYLLGGAFAASAWGYLMERMGRRNSIVLGLLIGALGSAVVLYAISIASLIVFLIGMVMMGIANAAVVLGRFAAAEVNLPLYDHPRIVCDRSRCGFCGSTPGPARSWQGNSSTIS